MSLRFSVLWKPKLKRHLSNQLRTPDLILRLKKQADQSRWKKNQVEEVRFDNPAPAGLGASRNERRCRMTRRLPAPWREEKISGGYVVRDASGLAIAHVYGRPTEADALAARS
jgi:hypothetical protein